MEEGKGVKRMNIKVEYIKLPRPYKNGHKEWGMDVISFRLPAELNAKLERAASKMKVSKSELIRVAIAKYLEEIEEND